MSKQGVILLNLGSPDSTEVSDVRRYLREFLMDSRVLDAPFAIRWFLSQLPDPAYPPTRVCCGLRRNLARGRLAAHYHLSQAARSARHKTRHPCRTRHALR